MKRLLLATSAVALMGSGAVAEISVSGDAEFAIDYDDGAAEHESKHAFNHEMGVDFTASGTTDNGLSFGAKAGFDSNDDTVNLGTVFISGAFGKLTFGDNDAADLLAGGIADVGLNGIGVDDVAEGIRGGTAAALRFDQSFGMIEIAISAGSSEGTEGSPEEVQYSFDVQNVAYTPGTPTSVTVVDGTAGTAGTPTSVTVVDGTAGTAGTPTSVTVVDGTAGTAGTPTSVTVVDGTAAMPAMAGRYGYFLPGGTEPVQEVDVDFGYEEDDIPGFTAEMDYNAAWQAATPGIVLFTPGALDPDNPAQTTGDASVLRVQLPRTVDGTGNVVTPTALLTGVTVTTAEDGTVTVTNSTGAALGGVDAGDPFDPDADDTQKAIYDAAVAYAAAFNLGDGDAIGNGATAVAATLDTPMPSGRETAAPTDAVAGTPTSVTVVDGTAGTAGTPTSVTVVDGTAGTAGTPTSVTVVDGTAGTAGTPTSVEVTEGTPGELESGTSTIELYRVAVPAVPAEDEFAFGMKFGVGSDISVGFGYDSNKVVSMGFGYSTGDVAGNLFYSRGKTRMMVAGTGHEFDQVDTTMGLDVAYTMGATTLTMVYAQHDTDNSGYVANVSKDAVGVGVSQDIGGGANVVAGFGNVDGNSKASVGMSFGF